MIKEAHLRDTLLALEQQNRNHYVAIAALLNEVASLRETVRGLDPTFGDVLRKKQMEEAERGAELLREMLSGYDLILQRLKEGYVC
jgi:hypothetical protein